MGYNEAQIVAGEFEVPADQQDAARQAIATFVRDLGYPHEIPSLAAALRLFEITVVEEDDRVVGLEFDGRILYELEDAFKVLAPYVEPGSYLHWRSGTGAEWRYLFDGDRMITSPN